MPVKQEGLQEKNRRGISRSREFEGQSERVTTMSIWSRYPTLYEINTWVWLSELSVKTGSTVDLGSVPSAEWDAIAKFGFDAVWFMGVWERSPAGIAIANQNKDLVEDFRRALPDFKPEDNVGSPYCIRRYGSTNTSEVPKVSPLPGESSRAEA